MVNHVLVNTSYLFIYPPTTPSNIFFRLLTFSLQLLPTSVLTLEYHNGVKYSGAI